MSVQVIQLDSRIGLEAFGLVAGADGHLRHLKAAARKLPRLSAMVVAIRVWELFEDMGLQVPLRVSGEAIVDVACDALGRTFVIEGFIKGKLLEVLSPLGEARLIPNFLLGSTASVRETLRRRVVRIFGVGMECDGPILEALYFAL